MRVDMDFKSLTGDKAIDESRGLQLLMWWLEEDHALLGAVVADIAKDPRGFEESLWELVVGLVGMLGAKWLEVADEEPLKAAIRVEIAKRDGGEGNS